MASLDVALNTVSQLEALSLPDEQPNIEAAPLSIVYDVSFDTNFEDRTAFITGVARYNEEATVQAGLNEILDEGEQHASTIYTWRSCSRAVPSVKSDDQPNRKEIYQMTVAVLDPEVNKLKGFHRFVESAVTRFITEVRRLAHENKRKDFVSETYLLTLGRLVNMFAILDALKNMKACINNDLAFYKRADGYLKRGSHDAQSLVELQNLTLFFATQNKLTSLLRSKLEEVPNYEEVLAEMVNMCLHLFENGMYLMPSEKHMLLRAVGFGVVLMDGKTSNIYKLDSKKKISVTRIDRAFKTLPVVPLYGDLQIALASYVKQSPHYDASKWACVNDSADEKLSSTQYNLLSKLDTIRAEHEQYSSELARFSNEVATIAPTTRTDAQIRDLTEVALRGLQRLSSWTCHLTELYSWKLLHPTDKHQNRLCPGDAEEYERALRYNFSSAEKFAMVEVIAMIKGLMALIQRMEPVFNEAIKRCLHTSMQDFIQKTLRDPIRRAIKHKKQTIKTVLMAMRETCVDWLKGFEPRDDPCLKGEKDPKMGYHTELPRRRVGPSSTQLYMIRTMVESLLSEKGGKRSLRQDMNVKDLPALESFLRRSFFYRHLLEFGTTLRECCDLSQFWFREFHLELTMGKRIQFPIEMSLPWILTDHILETKEPSMMEFVLFPLDLYSDSAHYSLHKFKKQYLYDEVEAEVNLCFDQFVFKISEQIFVYFKTQACSIYLDKQFRAHCAQATEPYKIPFPSCNRYGTILKQRHVQILGRSVDLNCLIAQRINAALHRALDLAISRFESGDLTRLLELETLIETNRLTHQMLSAYLTLDPFEAMLLEANQAVSSPYGRITLHCFWELNQDFLPNFIYNSRTNRFIRAKVSFGNSKDSQREAPPKAHVYYWFGNKHLNVAYNNILHLYTSFIGEPHFVAMTRLLGYQGIAMMIEELLKIMNSSLNGTIKSYVIALLEGMPKKCKLPLADYGSPGVFGFYHLNLQPILQYGILRTEVFQAFKEIGNAIVFCLQIEQCLSQEEILDLLQAAPFQGVYPKPFIKEGQNPDTIRQQMVKQYSPLQVVPVLEKVGTPMQVETAKEGHLLTKERLCRGLSMFEVVLKKIQSFLTDPVWNGPPPANGVMNVEECTEFHRLWSAIQFVYCLPPFGQGQFTDEECFGEGLQWAGLTLIVLLDQQKRFEAFDFSYRVAKVQESDGKDEIMDGKVPLKQFAERARLYQQLNRQIFGLLNKHLSNRASEVGENVRYFQPPIHQNFMSTV